MTTNNQIFGNKRFWTKSYHPLGIPKDQCNLRGVAGFTLGSLFLFSPWVISFNRHAHICVSSPETLPITISKGLWSLPAGMTGTSSACQMSMCCGQEEAVTPGSGHWGVSAGVPARSSPHETPMQSSLLCHSDPGGHLLRLEDCRMEEGQSTCLRLCE